MTIKNPKLSNSRSTSAKFWYRYYAGYSEEFAADALRLMEVPSNGVFLDPWNGSGTSTYAASKVGCSVIGFDLNPASVLISKGRLLDKEVVPSLGAIASDIEKKSNVERATFEIDRDDPLLQWFKPKSANKIRTIERAIQFLLVNSDEAAYQPIAKYRSLSGVSTLAAFYYVALFSLVGTMLSRFQTSNPTWVKLPRTRRHTLGPSDDYISRQFSAICESLSDYLRNGSDYVSNIDRTLTLDTAASDDLPVAAASVDAILTSPPYCTRIDYVVASYPELCTIGSARIEDLKSLRDKMIGTPTMKAISPKPTNSWGVSCLQFLDEVKNHSSKASHTYYFKYFSQYFHSIWKSMLELDRVTKGDARIGIVIQDSYYKEIRVDLAAILTEMGEKLNWRVFDRFDFPVKRNMSRVHPSARNYRKNVEPVESFIVYMKTGCK